jgi:hypothetical protein
MIIAVITLMYTVSPALQLPSSATIQTVAIHMVTTSPPIIMQLTMSYNYKYGLCLLCNKTYNTSCSIPLSAPFQCLLLVAVELTAIATQTLS